MAGFAGIIPPDARQGSHGAAMRQFRTPGHRIDRAGGQKA